MYRASGYGAKCVARHSNVVTHTHTHTHTDAHTHTHTRAAVIVLLFAAQLATVSGEDAAFNAVGYFTTIIHKILTRKSIYYHRISDITLYVHCIPTSVPPNSYPLQCSQHIMNGG